MGPETRLVGRFDSEKWEGSRNNKVVDFVTNGQGWASYGTSSLVSEVSFWDDFAKGESTVGLGESWGLFGAAVEEKAGNVLERGAFWGGTRKAELRVG